MSITEKGHFAAATLTDRGKYIFGNLNENGYMVFGTAVLGTPAITIISYTKIILSHNAEFNRSTVTFQSDQALTQWEARAGGTGQGQGLLVGSGTALSVNTDQSFDIDDSELTLGDIDYRINVYGCNAGGVWTVYG